MEFFSCCDEKLPMLRISIDLMLSLQYKFYSFCESEVRLLRGPGKVVIYLTVDPVAYTSVIKQEEIIRGKS
jgi:hypothetical protein